jgi:hypothetical protein
MNLVQGEDPRPRSAWVPSLPVFFEERGFVDVEAKVRETVPHLAVPLHECGLLAMEALVRNTKEVVRWWCRSRRRLLLKLQKRLGRGLVLFVLGRLLSDGRR